MRRLALIALLAVATPARAADLFVMPEDPDEAQFVTSNVLATFYHELGHALMDVLQLPVLGREEDAADTLSALLIHDIWDEESATQLVYDTARAYSWYDAEASAAGYEPALSDEHSLDLQRYYNLVCLYYGANPDARAEAAQDLELPPERAERCPAEFAQVEASWGGLLEGLEPTPGAKGLRLVETDAKDPIAVILQEEITAMNKTYALPDWVDVKIAPCGQANAFYAPDDHSITICSEYAPDIVRIWQAQPE